jgi:hypothetical protein
MGEKLVKEHCCQMIFFFSWKKKRRKKNFTILARGLDKKSYCKRII